MRIKRVSSSKSAFTLLELLVVIAVIGILTGLLFGGVSHAKSTAKKATCVNNLKQINLAILLYAGDHGDTLPFETNHPALYFREMVEQYVGLSGTASPKDKIFACPADVGNIGDLNEPGPYYENPDSYYTSYMYSARRLPPDGVIGVASKKIASIVQPTRTALAMETPAWIGYSWHKPQSRGVVIAPWQESQDSKWLVYNDGLNDMAFVDGHAAFIKTFNNGKHLSRYYNPPADYEYQWTAD